MTDTPDRAAKTARLEAAVDAALQSDGPLIVGPWLGEVGYELLYWIPFVRWALSTRRVTARPVAIVSRGGVASWYTGLGDRYLDAYALFAPDQLAALSGEAKPKQSATSGDPAGDAVVARVLGLDGMAGAARLLPHWMYRLYRPFWDGDEGVDGLAARARWSRVQTPAVPVGAGLEPGGYVAVRFYFSRSFPATEQNVQFARTMIETLARHVPVVLLSHPLASDDHQDFETSGANIRSVVELMTPETNLTVQTAVIGGARAFVGTYGGLSLLPPVCAVPAFAYCSVPFMKAVHELAISRMIDQTSGAPLVIGGTTDGQQEAERILRAIETARPRG